MYVSITLAYTGMTHMGIYYTDTGTYLLQYFIIIYWIRHITLYRGREWKGGFGTHTGKEAEGKRPAHQPETLQTLAKKSLPALKQEARPFEV
ncbi:hypothetical protein scyTo_0004306 [Scyliorhinus torazame]|uniref:Uncharacterized protein n=1 Tax=Scyliorhinus torazame TaxID=75743 RepID=A0A401NPD3_SCYTO|nr:hypothetical protein [Scyliorhinus torazame]